MVVQGRLFPFKWLWNFFVLFLPWQKFTIKNSCQNSRIRSYLGMKNVFTEIKMLFLYNIT